MDIIEHHGVKGMRWGHRKLHNMVENHKENLRYKYRKKGLNEQQVEAKLQRRLKTEKTLLKTAAVVGTAAAAYALKNKVQDDFIGRTIKKGKTFDSVSGADKIDKSRPVYGAFNKLDKLKYRGLYGTERKMRYGQTSDNLFTFKAKKDIKIAPNRAAKKTFDNLYKKDKDFKKAADELGIIYGGRAFKKYDKFNIGFVGRGDDKNTPHAKAIDKFYKELKRQGYSGVMDRNDKKFSGYRTKNPTIFFDQKHLKVAGKKRLTDEMIKKENGKAVPILTAQTLAKPAAALAAVTAYKQHKKNTRKRQKDTKYNEKYNRRD